MPWPLALSADGRALGGHAHRRHRGHKEHGRNLDSIDRLSVGAGELDAYRVFALLRSRGLGRHFDLDLFVLRSGAFDCAVSGVCILLRRSERSQRRLQLSLGIHQEVGRAYDVIAGLKSLEDYDGVVDLRAGLDLARFEIAVTMIDECNGS